MPLIHGRKITAGGVEVAVSQEFTPQDFACLCNAIAWASAGCRCASLPSFSERTNAKDGDVDAEWQEELPDDQSYSCPLLGPGWNVFQYKKRDILAQDRAGIFASLRTGVRGAVKDLYQRTGHRPDRYVLFTNVDLMHFTKARSAASPQKDELRAAVLEGYDQRDQIRVEIVAAAELAAFLNNLPHLRSAFFETGRFESWGKYRDQVEKGHLLLGTCARLVGRDEELARLRAMVDDPDVRAVVLVGAHSMGKTRIALEATAHRWEETVVALDQSMTVSDLLALQSSAEVVVIIEDPDPEIIDRCVDQALACSGLKLLITLSTAERIPSPNFGRDARVQVLSLAPLSDSQAQELLRAAQVHLDYGLESWILEQASGNPGILLLAASLAHEPRGCATKFASGVAESLERRIRRELGERSIRILGLLSLLTRLGIDQTPSKELLDICTLFGADLKTNDVLTELPRLADAGVIQRRGSYVEVLPWILANRLAANALLGRLTELRILFDSLDGSARLRLIRRLQALKCGDVDQFWGGLFGPRGLVGDLPSALANAHLLYLGAGCIPDDVWGKIENGLRRASVEERRSIAGEARRQLVWALEEPLFQKRMSMVALRCLVLLAEAETENYGNNATDVFCSCFRPLHPQLPLGLHDRLSLLKEILGSQSPLGLRTLGVKAIESGLSRLMGWIPLHPSTGPEPMDAPVSVTLDEARCYLEALIDLLMTAARSAEPALVKCAVAALPHALTEYAFQARPDSAVTKFEIVTGWLMRHEAPLSASDLSIALKLALGSFEWHRAQVEGAMSEYMQKHIEAVQALIKGLLIRTRFAKHSQAAGYTPG